MQPLLPASPCWAPRARPGGSALDWLSWWICSALGGGAEQTHRIVFKCLSRPLLLHSTALISGRCQMGETSQGRMEWGAGEGGGGRPRSDANAGTPTPLQKGLSRIMKTSGLRCGDSRWLKFQRMAKERCLSPRGAPGLGSFLVDSTSLTLTELLSQDLGWVRLPPFYGRVNYSSLSPSRQRSGRRWQPAGPGAPGDRE